MKTTKRGISPDTGSEMPKEDETVIADMSLLDERGVAERWFGKPPRGGRASPSKNRPLELLEGKERRTAIRAALAASLLIGLVYIAAAGLLILALLWLWR